MHLGIGAESLNACFTILCLINVIFVLRPIAITIQKYNFQYPLFYLQISILQTLWNSGLSVLNINFLRYRVGSQVSIGLTTVASKARVRSPAGTDIYSRLRRPITYSELLTCRVFPRVKKIY